MKRSKTNQTRWEWHHSTFTPSLHLVPFCQLCTPQLKISRCTLAYSNPLNESAMHSAFSTLLTTEITNTSIVGKMAQDVWMVWKYCGVIPILLGGLHPYMHLCLFRKLFCTFLCGFDMAIMWWQTCMQYTVVNVALGIKCLWCTSPDIYCKAM